MKILVISASLVMISFFVFSQSKELKPSPAAQASSTVDGHTITIDYHQPSVKGREIWGDLVPYGKVWRAGANETTSFSISADAQIGDQALAAGKYAFFVIPNEKTWTLILNKTIKWGAFSYKEAEDVLRFSVPVQKLSESTEKLTYDISEKGKVSLSWADAKASFEVKF